MPQILPFDGLYNLPTEIIDAGNDSRFDYIFSEGIWARSTNGESHSGVGSTLEFTKVYRPQLQQYLSQFTGQNITFFDAPCGDLNWVKDIIPANVKYIGGDISGLLIDNLKQQFPHHDLRKFDIITDVFPDADIWHCRHCLFHLSLSDIQKSLENFLRSNIQTALITNHFMPDLITFDIPTGSYRPLDLMNFPFYLPKPERWLLDCELLGGKNFMATGIWSREQISRAVENYKNNIS